MSTAVALSTDQRVERFQGHARKAVDGILGMGRCLIEDKEALGHGEWLPYLERIGVSKSMAHNLRLVAERFSNVQSSGHLPPSLDALVALTRANPERVEEGIESGEVNPTMTIREAKDFANPPPTAAPEPGVVDAEVIEDTPTHVNRQTGEALDGPAPYDEETSPFGWERAFKSYQEIGNHLKKNMTHEQRERLTKYLTKLQKEINQ